MSRSVRIFQVDAFTTRCFAGNPAGVVLGAESLAESEMQAIARELNNGDTAFLLPPEGADHELRVRFFTPRTEAGFVGHATVAAHAVRRALGLPAATRQQQRSGLVQVEIEAGDAGYIAIRQPPPRLQPLTDDALLTEALAALGLGREDLEAACPPTIAGAGSTRLLLALREAATLARLAPDLTRLADLSPRIGAAGYFLFSQRTALRACDTEARMFCPALGIAEDPVSGNAHGMLGAYLLQQRRLPVEQGRAQFRGAQGHHLGRPGEVRVELRLRDGALSEVTIAGQAVIVFESVITLP